MKDFLKTMTFIAGLFLGNQIQSCAWTYKTKIEARRFVVSEFDEGSGRFLLRFHKQFILVELTQKRDELVKNLALAAKGPQISDELIADTNDLAVVEMYLGEFSKSLEHLEKLESEHPGLYPTAANLGTAYELSGNNAKALMWIREGIRRNAEAHDGTEWLHVKILEAKISIANDPKWLDSHHVADIDFGDSRKPKMPKYLPLNNKGQEQGVSEVQKAFEYQLHERVQFVSPPDAVVADLLFSLGNIYALKEYLEDAIRIYKHSVEYSPIQLEIIEKRTSYFQLLIRWAACKFYGPIVGLAIGVISVIVCVVLFLVKRFKREKRDGLT